MAAALYAGDGALLSHRTAGLLWGIHGVRAKDVELWVSSSKKTDLPGITVHRGTRLDRADRPVDRHREALADPDDVPLGRPLEAVR